MKDGIILIDKPQNMTSFAVVACMRRKLGVKCGHAGTLDPLATGLLPVMCGKATKLCDYITDGDKAYRATLKFGYETDSCDITGNIIKRDEKSISLSDIKCVLPQFVGKIKQVPPSFSAIKVGGTALYKLARQGIAVDVPERQVVINSISIIDFSCNNLIMDVECSKGTYIRSLCRDIARSLGTAGTMSALCRTRVGKWHVENAVSLDDFDCDLNIISMDNALSEYPEFSPSNFYGTLLLNGCAVSVSKLGKIPDGICRVKMNGVLIGLGKILRVDGDARFKLVTHL